MQKIVYIISTLKKAGPVNVLLDLVSNLDRTKYKPYIITLSKETETSQKESFQQLNLPMICLNLSRYTSVFLGHFKLNRIINKIKPDLIHTHCFRSNMLAITALRKYKTFTSIHCDFTEDFPLHYGKLIGFLACKINIFAIKRISKTICVSKTLANILGGKFPKLRFFAVDNGINMTNFCPSKDKLSLRKKLHLPFDKKIFIWCGSFIHRKNPLLLVESIKQFKNDNCFFIFCGAKGILFEQAKDELKNYKNVLFAGYLDNIAEYLQASDFYISTSLSEGFHLTVYESMACGVPVILPKISVYNKIFENDMALTFCLSDVQTLTKCLEDSLRLDYKIWRDNSIIFVKKYFSAQVMTKNYQKFYEDI
ncbi:MAG: glycosyltransferase [Endomicrobiaceae bacterium]|jgi:glycosyltransferase involved in cell wall biosynthesis|nr:glycosyltransferase [Endomicrobiaceae bacterium]MDD3729452.1 glycosyltransferase [Endomicrobiaceae bacterium]MDD4165601.1 glycosyltransferase [Endomicrobiaceae bacterium]